MVLYKYIQKLKANNYMLLFICLSIVTYPTGPFLPDLFLVITIILLPFCILAKNQYKTINKPILYFFLILFLYLIVRSTFSIDPIFSLKSTLFYFRFYLFSICLYFLIQKDLDHIKLLYWTLLFIIIFVVLDTFYQYFFNKDFFGFVRPNSRLSGPFGDELIVGSYLAKMTPFLFALYFYYANTLKFFHIVLLGLIFILVFLSGERTAFFYIVVFFTILFFFYKKNNLKILLLKLLFLLILISLSVVISNKDVKNRMINSTICSMNLSLLNSKVCSPNKNLKDSNRVIIFSKSYEGHYLSAYKMFKNNLYFGVGPKLFRFYCDKEKYYNKHSCTTHPHNTLLQILAEIGIIGFIFYLTAIIYLLKIFYYLVIKNKNVKNNHKFSIILLYVCFFQKFFFLVPSGQFFNNYLSIITYLPLGLFLIYINLYKIDDTK
jgi:O-antigen ligase